jgi:drug/metabolite transporter (DMT)-like permease
MSTRVSHQASQRFAGGAVLGQFVLLASAWGASFLFIKVGLEGLSPGQVVLGRLVAGAVTLVVISTVTRQSLPRRPVAWAHLTVVAVLLCVAPFLLFAWAEQHIGSGLASIYNATTPLMTMLVALAALPQERPTKARLAGLLTGFAGVVVVLAPWQGVGSGDLLAQGACLLATASYGLAFVYLRRFVSPLGLDAVPAATVQVGLGALIMGVLSPFLATGPVHLTGQVVFSVLALGAVGTGLAYVWNNNIVTAWGATNASTVTYLTPVVGVLLGVAVLREPLGWNEPVGAAVVVAGIAISQGRFKSRSRKQTTSTGADDAAPHASVEKSRP